MPIKHTNFASSKLAVGVGPSDVTLSVTGTQGARFPALGAGDYCYLVIENATKQREIVKATARTVDTFTVVRGQDDTTAQAWVAGDTVSLRFVKAAIADSIGNAVQRTSATGSVIMPVGTTAQRDGTPSTGYLRYNTTTAAFEGYNGTGWAAVGGSSSGMEGEICYFARNTAPAGFLKANGALVSRTTYAALFAAIGTAFGAGDGSTTFALPDLRGEFPRGWDDARGVDAGRAFGSAQLDQIQGHGHQAASLSGGSQVPSYGSGAPISTGAQAPLAPITDGTNGTPRVGTETRPRNVALLACIRF